MRAEQMQLPGYEIVEILGQGGFATVYRARQLAVGREVALKVDSRVLSSPRDQQRFLREVTAAGQLSGHPHVVAVYDAGVLSDGRPHMVLELCPGGSLADRLRRHGPLPSAEARDIGVSIADALAAAHAAGVLHRDIKPGNIMVNQYGGVALADFGLAAIPRPGHELSVTREALTPAYAPPEAFRTAEPAPAGDVYSLAATVYALLRGRPPHYPDDGELSLAELIVRHTWPVPDLPGVPAALTEVLRHAMAPDPADRLPTAGALRDALATADLNASAPARATTVPMPRDTPPSSVPSYAPPAAQHIPPPLHPPGGSGRTTAAATEPDGRGRRGRRPRLITVLAAVAVSVSISVTVVVNQKQSASDDASSGPSTSASASARASGFVVPTTTENCPAAAVEGVGGRCTTTAECWSGMVIITGIVSVSRADCKASHVWETFAIAPLPKDGMTNNYRDLSKHPDVLKLCSTSVMTESRTVQARGQWSADVLPPTQTEYADGLRVFRCVAAVDGEVAGNHFRPRG